MFWTYLEQAVIDTAVSVLAIYCMGIAGTLTHDQTNPWEQENKRSHFACGRKISRTFVQGLDFVRVTQGNQYLVSSTVPSALHCLLSRGVAGNGYYAVVWNITGLQERCRNSAMQFKLLMYSTRDKMENFLLWADVKERD